MKKQIDLLLASEGVVPAAIGCVVLYGVYKFWPIFKAAFAVTDVVAKAVNGVGDSVSNALEAVNVGGWSAVSSVFWTGFGFGGSGESSPVIVQDKNGNVTDKYGSTYTLDGQPVNVTQGTIDAQNEWYNNNSGTPFMPF